ncbi:MAG: hypothetical protein BWY21_00364 [Parcubacteria group bacterium ADurb.Bin216]|nr:MAG: hypothetical protein BWY21_00364 [Parcubacteria group bacterium ADurb.Bin216]
MKASDVVSVLGRHGDIMTKVYDRINKHHKKPLHKGQIQLARDYFVRGMRIIMSQWGRSSGKTESALFVACVASLLNDNFLTYIITPERKQGKEIYCASRRLQDYAPQEYVKDFNITEQRLVFKNHSFICVDGCENYNAHRGLKPNLVIYDEFQNHNREFHLEVMAPNLLAKQSSLMIFGTPPKQRSAYYVEFREQLLKQIKEGDVTRAYYEFPTSINPTIDEAELAKTRKELIDSGNDVIWQREYEGKLAFGGEDVVFPKWNPVNHVRTHKVVMSFLEPDKHHLKWYTICDPGASSCFGVLFAAHNPYTQQVFMLDEIYEKDRMRTDTKSIWNRIKKKQAELFPGASPRAWKVIYDEQAAWFQREIAANFKEGVIPSMKQKHDREDEISRIKMLMANHGSLIVSDRCYWLRWEIESFITDELGRYPDKNNHLLDCFVYLMQYCNWKLLEKADNDVVEVQSPEVKANNLDPNDWADTVVEDSLWRRPDDIYSEYF